MLTWHINNEQTKMMWILQKKKGILNRNIKTSYFLRKVIQEQKISDSRSEN